MILTYSILISAFFCTQVYCDPLLKFQEDNIPVNTSRATLFLESSAELSNFTVCLWFKVSFFRYHNYAFSFASSQKLNNQLNLGIRTDQVFIVIDGRTMRPHQSTSIVPNFWNHTCFVSSYDMTKLYIDGRLISEMKMSRNAIPLNGSFVLGQETDTYNGGFQKMQSFAGEITSLNLYNSLLSDEDVLSLATCGDVTKEKIIDWNNVQWSEVEEVTISDIDPLTDICNKREEIIVITEREPFSKAVEFCNAIGSQLTAPTSEEENQIIHDTVRSLRGTCKPKNHAHGYFWLGNRIRDGKWINRQNENMNYSNSISGYSNGMAYYHTLEHYTWKTMREQSSVNFCFACDVSLQPLNLRGICGEYELEHMFIVDQKDINERPIFRGYSKLIIKFDEDSSTWFIHDTWENLTIASWFTVSKEYPIGLKGWTIMIDYAICEYVSGTTIPMMLSKCNSDEFSCNDGTCVDISDRCDLNLDCSDGSDERNCETLSSVTDNYLKALLPPTANNQPLNLNMSVEVLGVSEVDIRNLRITVEFTYSITWLESRATFRNLKTLADMNIISNDKLWTPEVEFVNADFPQISMKTSPLIAVRQSDPQDKDLSMAVNDEIFHGLENPIILKKKVSAPINCKMNLELFPFDSQTCNVDILLISAYVDNAVFDNVSASYIGEKWLTEYLAGSASVQKAESNRQSLVRVYVPLKRRFAYYFTSAYIPMLLMMLIGLASLHLKYESVDLRVMLSITTLLVLYSLYQQISNDLPKTSYIKSIDVWCFFSICYLFSIVIFQTLISHGNQIAPLEKDFVYKRKVKMIICAKIFFSLTLVLFVIFYFVDIYLRMP